MNNLNGKKWATLPGISSGPGGPQIPYALDNEIVPYYTNEPQSYAFTKTNDEDKASHLVYRVDIIEKTNRALVDEVMRLQNELKIVLKQNEEFIKQNNSLKKQFDSSLRNNHDFVSQLSERVRRNEDKAKEEHTALSSLASHSKSIELALVNSQKEVILGKDAYQNKISELTVQLNNLQQTVVSHERNQYQAVEDVRTLKSQLDQNALNTMQLFNEYKHKTNKIEEDSRNSFETARKNEASVSHNEYSSNSIRNIMDKRLDEFREFLTEMRSRQEREGQERRALEQQVTLRMDELHSSISGHNLKREETFHMMETSSRGKEHQLEMELSKVQRLLKESTEDLNKKVLQKEMKLREEAQNKFHQLEEVVKEEQTRREKFERNVQRMMEDNYNSYMENNNVDIKVILEKQKAERRKQKEIIHQLNEAMTLMDRQMVETSKKTDRILAAEIHSRQQQERIVQEKMLSLEKSCTQMDDVIQNALENLTGNVLQKADDGKLRDVVLDFEQTMKKRVNELELNVKELNDFLKEENLRTVIQSWDINEESQELKEGQQVLQANKKAASEKLNEWLETTNKAIVEITEEAATDRQTMDNIKYILDTLIGECENKIHEEKTKWEKDIEMLKKKLDDKPPDKDDKGEADDKTEEPTDKPEEPTDKTEEIEALSGSMRKLAESIQTVKTVLGMKIQKEAKTREDAIDEVNKKVEEIEKKVGDGKDDKADG